MCARGMGGSGEISSFELQFMHIPILRIYCWKLLFSLSTLYMGLLYQFSGMTPKAESVCKGDPSLRRGTLNAPHSLPQPDSFIYPSYQAFASGE